MTEVSTPRDEIPPDVLHEHPSRESATGTPDTLTRNEKTERAKTSSADTTSSDGAVRLTVGTPFMEKVLDTESRSSTSELVIDVKNLTLYSHGVKRREQRGLDLKVPKGIIYGLIGRDGSGLLRLLEYILGSRRCPEGRVRVLGSAPCHPGSSVPGPGIGFMTSLEISFGWDLTVREFLHFVGKIYGMSETSIQHRIESLSKSLSLPDDAILLADVNVDESHLVILAAGLIHSPALLVFRDVLPSADPIVRMRIWSHLRRLTREEGLTILLSSSDFGVLGSQCDMVGIMCSGRIVAEGPPRLLLDKFKTDTLEELFLQLTLADEEKPVIGESHPKKSLITETRNQDGRNEVDCQISEMNPESDVKSVPSLDPTRATEQPGMPHGLSSRILMLTKLNLFLLTSGHGSFLKQLLTSLIAYYALAIATLAFCYPAIASEKALNVSTDSLGDISNISAALSGDDLRADGEPSASESMLSGLMFSLIFGMGLAVGSIGRKFRANTHVCYVVAGARPCEIMAAHFLNHMCVMLILEAFLLVPVFGCYYGSDSIHSESVALIIVLCYLQGFQGMVFGDPAALPHNMPYILLAMLLYLCTLFNVSEIPIGSTDVRIMFDVIKFVVPQRLPSKALRYIIFRGWGIEYYEVWSGILASIAWSTALPLLVILRLCSPRTE